MSFAYTMPLYASPEYSRYEQRKADRIKMYEDAVNEIDKRINERNTCYDRNDDEIKKDEKAIEKAESKEVLRIKEKIFGDTRASVKEDIRDIKEDLRQLPQLIKKFGVEFADKMRDEDDHIYYGKQRRIFLERKLKLRKRKLKEIKQISHVLKHH